MRRIWPAPGADGPEGAGESDAVATHLNRARPAPEGRPWVMANMVSSVDGAATRSGRSGGLGGDADRAVFHALRTLPDVILVGAGTVRAERYRPPSVAAGRAVAPRLAIVSGRLLLDPDLPCLRDAPEGEEPLVLTGDDAPADRRELLEPLARVVSLGPGPVSAPRALAALADAGAGLVLCEGGPTLLGQLAEHDLVDEWFVTVAPIAVGGREARITLSDIEVDRHLRLESVITDGADLLLAYVRASIS